MVDLRLLIIAADPLIRAGLVSLLDDHEDLQIVGQIGLSDALANEITIYQPAVIVWDLGWDPEDSLELLDSLDLDIEVGGPAVLALLPDSEAAQGAWSAGVQGLLFRQAGEERLIATVRALYWGLIVIEPELMSELAPAQSPGEATMVEELTEREIEVLGLLAEGLSNKAIAQELAISDHTVKFHVNAIMTKLGAQSRTAAVVQAMRLGLIVL